MLFAYPETALANRPITKKRIYQQQQLSTAIKDLFTTQVESITWLYKLAANTLNIAESVELPELQVFKIVLKNNSLEERVLSTIDTAIPSPIIFELHTTEQVQICAAFKPYGGSQKTTHSRYFYSPWHPQDTERQPLPYAANIEQLYGKLLGALLPYPAKEGENINAQIERIAQIEKLEHAITRCQARLRKEKQLNKQAPINRELRALKQELSQLIPVTII